MRDGFFLGVMMTLYTAFIMWLAIGEIRHEKSKEKPWWVAFNGAVLLAIVGINVALYFTLPN